MKNDDLIATSLEWYVLLYCNYANIAVLFQFRGFIVIDAETKLLNDFERLSLYCRANPTCSEIPSSNSKGGHGLFKCPRFIQSSPRHQKKLCDVDMGHFTLCGTRSPRPVSPCSRPAEAIWASADWCSSMHIKWVVGHTWTLVMLKRLLWNRIDSWKSGPLLHFPVVIFSSFPTFFPSEPCLMTNWCMSLPGCVGFCYMRIITSQRELLHSTPPDVERGTWRMLLFQNGAESSIQFEKQWW